MRNMKIMCLRSILYVCVCVFQCTKMASTVTRVVIILWPYFMHLKVANRNGRKKIQSHEWSKFPIYFGALSFWSPNSRYGRKCFTLLDVCAFAMFSSPPWTFHKIWYILLPGASEQTKLCQSTNFQCLIMDKTRFARSFFYSLSRKKAFRWLIGIISAQLKPCVGYITHVLECCFTTMCINAVPACDHFKRPKEEEKNSFNLKLD